MTVRVEFTVCPGSQPMRLQKIDTDEELNDIEKFGVRNSERTALGGQLLTRHDASTPQLSSIVASHE